MNKAYLVILAIGTASMHDTGRRMEIDVIAPSKLDAAVIAERNGNVMVADDEYVYAKNVRPVGNGAFGLFKRLEHAMAI
jgi:hypothetical protein